MKQQKIKSVVSTIFHTGIVLMIMGCATKFKRVENCSLDKINVKGDVRSIELITVSSFPITDLKSHYGKGFDYNIHVGNSIIEFDDAGNRTSIKYYNSSGGYIETTTFDSATNLSKTSNGEFTTKEKDTIFIHDKQSTLASIVNKGEFNAPDSTIIYNYETGNKTILQFKYDAGKLILQKELDENRKVKSIQNSYYNTRGDIAKIVNHNYITNEIISTTDSTTFDYTEYDNNNNWTEVTIIHESTIASQNYKAKSMRKLHYNNDDTKHELLNKIGEFEEQFKNPDVLCEIIPNNISGIFELGIPQTSEQSDEYVGFGYNYAFKAKNRSEYAMILVKLQDGQLDPNFRNMEILPEDDRIVRENTVTMLANENSSMLKWYGVKSEDINNQYFMSYSYDRTGSPLPVHVEVYLTQTKSNTITIIMSYRISESNLWKKNMRNSILKFKVTE